MTEKSKKAASTTSAMVRIKNLQDGPRTYPLKDGSGVHLPGKHRGAVYPVVAKELVGPTLEAAAKKGLILIVEEKGGEAVGTGNAESNVD